DFHTRALSPRDALATCQQGLAWRPSRRGEHHGFDHPRPDSTLAGVRDTGRRSERRRTTPPRSRPRRHGADDGGPRPQSRTTASPSVGLAQATPSGGAQAPVVLPAVSAQGATAGGPSTGVQPFGAPPQPAPSNAGATGSITTSASSAASPALPCDCDCGGVRAA